MKVTVQQIAEPATKQKIPCHADFQKWGSFIEEVLKPEQDSEVCVRIVHSPESQALNALYRQQEKPTNVLAFPYATEIPGEDTHYLGDIVLDLDTVTQEARRDHKKGLSHWAHLFVHGVLHLYGYRHDREDQAQCMRDQEICILERMGFTNPYREWC